MHASPKRTSILDWSNSVFKSATPSIFEERESDHEDFETYLTRLDARGSLGFDLNRLDGFEMKPSPSRAWQSTISKSVPGKLRKRRSTLS
jgi:hypothetical protein